MNKTLLLLTVIFASFSSSFAQKIRFTDSTNIWWEQGTWIEIPAASYIYHKYHYTGDSLIGGENYRMLFDMYCTKKFPEATNPFPTKNCKLQFVGFVREDTTDGIVYFGKYTSSVFAEDTLYNYNWQVDDTFSTGFGSNQVAVLAIDTVFISADTHRVWQLQYFDAVTGDNEDFHVIEGIGNTKGMFRHLDGLQPSTTSSTSLFCFRHETSNPPLSKAVDAFDNQNSCVTSVEKTRAVQRKEAAVIPHPANSGSYIQFPYRLTGTVVILNQLGQVVISERISNAERWMLGSKIPAEGLYIYHIIDETTGEQFSGKLIYQ